MRTYQVWMVKALLQDFPRMNRARVTMEARKDTLTPEEKKILQGLQKIADEVANAYTILTEREKQIIYNFYFQKVGATETAKIVNIKNLKTIQVMTIYIIEKMSAACLSVFSEAETFWEYDEQCRYNRIKEYMVLK